MIFDVVKATHCFSKQGDGKESRSLMFEVVPNERYQLDFGDKHVLIGSGYHRFKATDRQPVQATISVTANAAIAKRVKGKDACGSANFYQEQGKLDIYLAVEPELFEAMAATRIDEPGAAAIMADIEELEFGPDIDGEHQVWKLEGSEDRVSRKPVSHFWFNAASFSTTEQAVYEAGERRHHAQLAASSDPEDRKLAASLQPEKPDPVVTVLRQCRSLLVALFILGVVALATWR